MKGTKTKAIGQFLVLVPAFPFCFLALREVVKALLSAWELDNTACTWLDQTLNLSPNLTHQWFTDLLSIPPTLWTTLYLLAAVSEIRLTKNVTALKSVEILGRYVALATSTQLLPLAAGVFFFHGTSLVTRKPIAVILALALVAILFRWGWRLPGQRIKKVEAVYNFENVKEV